MDDDDGDGWATIWAVAATCWKHEDEGGELILALFVFVWETILNGN